MNEGKTKYVLHEGKPYNMIVLMRSVVLQQNKKIIRINEF